MPSNWNSSAKWYTKTVGESGHFYHQTLILPKVKLLLSQIKPASLIDFGCGQGILARVLPNNIKYFGIDSSVTLIKEAKRLDQNSEHKYRVADMAGNLSFIQDKYDFATCILSLQNCNRADLAIKNLTSIINPTGHLLIVLNHPCFRIPRQSGWGVDPKTNLQYRYLNRYLKPLKIPIRIEPSKGEQSPIAWSYHFALQDLFKWLNQNHMAVINLEEWTSGKVSEGKMAKSEDRARTEFPLFLSLLCQPL
jgi:ubiquinone/menaquinone biosynthesis C-methylase UbiE